MSIQHCRTWPPKSSEEIAEARGRRKGIQRGRELERRKLESEGVVVEIKRGWALGKTVYWFKPRNSPIPDGTYRLTRIPDGAA